MFETTHTVTSKRQPQSNNHHLTRVDITCPMSTRRPSHVEYSTVETLSRTDSHELSWTSVRHYSTRLLFRVNPLHHRVQLISSFMTKNCTK